MSVLCFMCCELDEKIDLLESHLRVACECKSSLEKHVSELTQQLKLADELAKASQRVLDTIKEIELKAMSKKSNSTHYHLYEVLYAYQKSRGLR